MNPVEGVWSRLRWAVTANTVFASRDHLVRAVRAACDASSTHHPSSMDAWTALTCRSRRNTPGNS
ncbi:hypothetical protein ACFYMW_31315 [Streptomyces sp. NPDC006692]|uniref:hypothetical protein n=1 Tax=Streptomyces sp. NPDC006692 TaxID=3364758 RepID=UPI003690EB18